MERDYHSELRNIFEQLKRIADAMESAEQRALRAEPIAMEIMQLSLEAGKNLKKASEDI